MVSRFLVGAPGGGFRRAHRPAAPPRRAGRGAGRRSGADRAAPGRARRGAAGARDRASWSARCESDVGIRVDRVVVNAILPRPFPAGLDDLDERLRRLPEDAPLGALPTPRVLAACAAHLRARYELNEHWARTLAASTGLPCRAAALPRRRGGGSGEPGGARRRAARGPAGGGGVSAADFAQLSLLRPRIAVCVGSGGVGKTTVAAALALEAARRGRRALVLTIDPARRLADALGVRRARQRARGASRATRWRALGVPPQGSLSAMMLDMKRTFDDLVERFAESPGDPRAHPREPDLSARLGGARGQRRVLGDGEGLRARMRSAPTT